MATAFSHEQVDSVARLSDGQLACLRMVMDGHTSKEIAKTLSISPHTVDQRIRIAMQTLGVANRFEAARLVRAVEQQAYQPLIPPPEQRTAYQAAPLVRADRPDLPLASSDVLDGNRDHPSTRVAETRPAFEPLPSTFALPSQPPKERGARNDLTPTMRVAWTVSLMIGLVLALSLLVTTAEGLARILDAIRP